MSFSEYQNRILEAMKQKKISKQQLAELSGKGKATITRYMSQGENRTTPNLDDFEALADALGVSTHWLCFGIGGPQDSVEQLNKMSNVRGNRINVYTRAESGKLLAGEDATPIDNILVDSQYSECFAVEYPVHGSTSARWDCYAIVEADTTWYNEDMVFARLGDNPTPDFYTLLRTKDSVIVYYLEDTDRAPIHQGSEDDLDIVGVVRWGTWEKR